VTSDPVASKTGGCRPLSGSLISIAVMVSRVNEQGTNVLFIGILCLPKMSWAPKRRWQAREWILARGGVLCPLLASSSLKGECALLVGGVHLLSGS
jgi:hypothetical protein